MNKIKSVFAGNLAAARRQAGWSQAELGEKLNYSDKSVSKWERGDGMPDVATLKVIADLLGVTTDWLLTEHEGETVPVQNDLPSKVNYRNIIRVALLSVWTAGVIVMVILWLVLSKVFWLCLVVPLPASMIVWLVLNSVWNGGKRNVWLVQGLLLSFFILMYCIFFDKNPWQIIFIAVPAQLIAYFSFRILKR